VRTRLYIAGGVLLAVVAAFLGGRFAAPVRVEEKVRVETRTVTVTEWKDRIIEKRIAGPVRVRTITIEKPGGERVVERIVERGPVTTETAADLSGSTAVAASSAAASSRVVESARPGWRASVAAGWAPERLTLRPEVYGVEVSRRIVGTVWIGAWARTDRMGGLVLAMEF
jgi:hypothetical protein